LLFVVFPFATAAQTAPTTASTTLPWLDSFDAGYQQSQRTGQPIFVFAGAFSVSASRRQWDVLQTPALSEPLQHWTRVRLTSDAARSAVRHLGVVTLPAIRVLSPDGTVVSAKDTFTDADELAKWLVEVEKLATARRDSPSAGAPPDAIASAVGALGDANPAVRAAAIGQLRELKEQAAGSAVVECLATGSLAQRLSAIDLLETWNAPIVGIDPWEPASLTPQRLAALREWAKHPGAATTAVDPVATARDLRMLASAPTDADARAIRESLVEYGEALLPQVYACLKANPPDPARQRLVALRYRLVATDRLAREWPGGFDRLAAADAGARRAAMADLQSHARPEDHRLLTELFSDDDPFVREQALRLLRSVGGAETNKELVTLLNDPEPNVRAAVLKTLADAPDAALADDLVRYVKGETDTDLLVHAVRVLEQTPAPAAFTCLVDLLKHPQWRVRGEAAEAMLGKLTGRDAGAVSEEQKQVGYAALIERLGDEDGYVVNKAVFTLIKANFVVASSALMKAAETKPDVARDVLRAVARDEEAGKAILPQIRELTKSPRADIRAAAVTAVISVAPETCGDTVRVAMHDTDPAVRIAGVRGAVTALQLLIPRNGYVTRHGFLGFGESQVKVDLSKWVEDFRKGVDRPSWLNDAAGDLTAMLNDPDARLPAAVVLCALGKDDLAMPVLLAATPPQWTEAAAAMSWLPWEQRLALFRTYVKASSNARDLEHVVQQLVLVPDARVADPLWDLLAKPDAAELFEPVHDGLRELYLGQQYYNANQLPVQQRTAATAAAKEKAEHGTEFQRTVALSLLLMISPQEAIEPARAIYEDHSNGEWPRLDALQVLLLAQTPDESVKTAVAALAEKSMRKIAVPFLAGGAEAVRQLRGSVYLYSTSGTVQYYGNGQVVNVFAPAGLTVEPVRAVLKDAIADGNSDLAGYAGYLLVLLGEHDGFEPLNKSASEHDLDDPWGKLLYRAISHANDDAQTPMLEAIYNRYVKNRNWEVRELYWTIRTMTGERILKLRKRIRDEYGMDRLR
jgi:HEAT repeat protein